MSAGRGRGAGGDLISNYPDFILSFCPRLISVWVDYHGSV